MLWNYSPNHTVSLPRTVESYVQERLHLEDKRTTIPQQAGELLTQWHSVISQNSWILSPRTASSWRRTHYDPSKCWGTTHPMTQCHIPEQLNPKSKNSFILKTKALRSLNRLGNYSPNDTVSYPRTVESSVQEWLHPEDKGTTTPQNISDYSPAASHDRRLQTSIS